ncbi:MAG: fibronectin type III-like domain-contianing protein, partial [Muribaculaceae bacterium]
VEKKGNKWIATINVKNTGNVSGKEVVQLYISAPKSTLNKPNAELKAFGKTRELKPGESDKILLHFTDYDLASFDELQSQWLTSKGKYLISFGSSSRNIKSTVSFNINKEKCWKVNDVLRPVEKVNTMSYPSKL